MASASVPRVERLKVTNYRALQNLDLDDIQPLTVFLGPNGSGKSTIFDVFAFLSECFTLGLRKAWEKRGRFRELRTTLRATGAGEIRLGRNPEDALLSDGPLRSGPPQLIGIEEPENYLHPRLLPELAEECRQASSRTQLMVTTHSPFFVNGLRAKELWVLYRDEKGFTQALRADKMRGVNEFMQHGAKLGHLWMEGHFEVGDPLVASGGPRRPTPAASTG